MTLSLPVAVLVSAVVLAVGLALGHRRASASNFNHAQLDRITTLIAELQFSVEKRLDHLTHEFHVEMASLHTRIEHLEQRDRERPT